PEAFEKQLTEKFKERAKVDLSKLKDEKVPHMAKELLPQLVDVSKKTVADYQPVINKQGVGFKGFIPATFGTQTAAKFTAKSGIYLKQTTLDGFLRNPKNKADEFEAGVLKKLPIPEIRGRGGKAFAKRWTGGRPPGAC